MQEIKEYPIVPIGRSKDLTGKTIGDFIVLYRTASENSNSALWLCQCQACQQYKTLSAVTVQRGKGLCECRNDLTGKRFGRLVVLKKTEKRTSNRGVIWLCRCDCGNEKEIPGETLKRGESVSCGCYQKEIASEKGGKNKLDLTGQRFGKLVALYPIYSKDRTRHTRWHCRCDCGNECDIDLGNLRQGFSKSCGCTQSTQEEKIIKLLTDINLPFSYQYHFNDYPQKKFDFFVDNHYIIEYDGQQHFFCKHSGWDTEAHLERTRESDLAKNKYCFEHNIPLIRIPYNKPYEAKDLQLATTRFLLTPENEQVYYNLRRDNTLVLKD